jgi:ribosomal-protein-alanine N-acetyltransferase
MKHIRMMPMSLRDLDEVFEIEQASHVSPWTRGQFQDSLIAGHWAYTLKHLSEEGPDILLGYCLLMPGVDEIHLLNITIHSSYRRQGLAKRILNVIESEARSKGYPEMLLEVRSSNTEALALYRSLKFDPIGVRKNYYPAQHGVREDAVVMKKNLGQ